MAPSIVPQPAKSACRPNYTTLFRVSLASTRALSRSITAKLASVTSKLSPEQLEELRAIDSPTIANAIEYFEARPRIAGYCGSNVRCLTPNAGFMLGYAVTCKGDSTTEDRDRREHTELYRAIVGTAPLPAVVVIGDDGDPSKIHLSCHAGEMMATTMK